MRWITSLVVSAVVFGGFAALPAFAQRGNSGSAARGGSMSGGMGAEMGHGSMRSQGGTMMGQEHPMPGMEHGTHHTMGVQKTPRELLSQNTKLASKLETLLPPGKDVQEAAAGFRNLGEFVAAAHVSNNLAIPFEALKAKLTASERMSLGKAIKELKPDADAKAEARKAKEQAKQDLESKS